MPQILKSDGVTNLSSNSKTVTNRNMVKVGHAVVVTPGVTGFDVIKLKTAALDTQYNAATLSVPVVHIIDDIRFVPTQFPENF
jgi:hypothetical protein